MKTQELPDHIGIIMDGNGRWAKQRSLPRTAGHKEGLETAKRIIKILSDLGLKYLTLYTFSTENWKRAQEEVSFLMNLIKSHLKKEYDFYRENGIRVLHCGDLEGLPIDIQEETSSVIKDTAEYKGITVILAINYGGRDEIIRAVRRLINNNKENSMETVTEDSFANYLDVPGIPDPDLIIRSAGEQRLSNFLIWQSAYAEYYFSPVLWPDWGRDEIMKALLHYRNRNRKFGGVN